MDIHLATFLGLKSHPLLISSRIENGRIKLDYLCAAKVSILDVETELVVKVGRNNPRLLGLDAMFRYDMNLKFAQGEFSIRATTLLDHNCQFNFLKFEELLQKVGLTLADLKPIDELPYIKESYKFMLKTKDFIIDCGTTFADNSKVATLNVQ